MSSVSSCNCNETLRAWFQEVDFDGNGTISSSELESFLFDSGRQLKAATCASILQEVLHLNQKKDPSLKANESDNGSEELNFQEFCLLVSLVNGIINVYQDAKISFPASRSNVEEVLVRCGIVGAPATTCQTANDLILFVISHIRYSADLGNMKPFEGLSTPSVSLELNEELNISQERSFPMGFSDTDYALLKAKHSFLKPLHPSDQALVKETWNKLLAWKDMAIESFFLRWLALCGEKELTSTLGPFFEPIQEILFEFLDMSVRGLNSKTELIARESYRGVHDEKHHETFFSTKAQYLQFFAQIGIRPEHWVKAGDAWLYALKTHVPYAEEPEQNDMSKSNSQSAIKRFFELHIKRPAIQAISELRIFLTSYEVSTSMTNHFVDIGLADEAGKANFAALFYSKVKRDKMLNAYLTTQDRSDEYFETIVRLVLNMPKFFPMMRKGISSLGEYYRQQYVPSWVHSVACETIMNLIINAKKVSSSLKSAHKHLFSLMIGFLRQPMLNEETMLKKAREYQELFANEHGWSEEKLESRMTCITDEIRATGMYEHTSEEIEFGARVAWRNSAKCIGRINWNSMIVRDRRDVHEPSQMFQECLKHLEIATGGPTIVSVMTIFAPRKKGQPVSTRFWASQFMRYACYEQENGKLLGDPANLELTNALMSRMGWKPPAEKTAFDVLPAVIEVPGEDPIMFEWPKEYVYEVAIEHPENPKFVELGLRWCTVPTISNFRVTLGGIDYCACPFNGWFMELEICRNLLERYDAGPSIAKVMGMSTEGITFWQPKVQCELARAVHHSFVKSKYSIVDHQTASRQFMAHCTREREAGREVPGQWSWIGGLVGPQCPVWHHEMRDFYLEPQYHYQSDAFLALDVGDQSSGSQDSQESEDVVPPASILILFGSQTGTSETWARKVSRKLDGHHITVACLNDFPPSKHKEMATFQYILIFTSTFGNGGPPFNAENFLTSDNTIDADLSNSAFAVLAAGSRAYAGFCEYGLKCDNAFYTAGASRLMGIAMADELAGQFQVFETFQNEVCDIIGKPSSEDGVETSRSVIRIERHEAIGEETASNFNSYIPVHVLSNDELLETGDVEKRSSRCIVFDTDHADLKYQTGDHVSIRPKNHSDMIQRFVDSVEDCPELTTCLTGYESSGDTETKAQMRFPNGSSLQDILSIHLSLRVDPSLLSELIPILKQHAEEKENSEAIKYLTEIQADTSKASFDDFPEVSMLLNHISEKFGLKFSFDLVLPCLSSQKDRYYSISSSALKTPKQIMLTVGVMHTKTSSNIPIKGLCSYYLAKTQPGDIVYMKTHTSEFHHPSDLSSPVILAGAGTGLAPLIGLMLERHQLKTIHSGSKVKKLGSASLFFGCRSRNEVLYREKLKSWQGGSPDEKVLDGLWVAYSRESEVPKQYVSDLIRTSRVVVEKLLDPKCHFYFCGDALAADGCYEAIISALEKFYGLTRLAAIHHLDVMQSQGRYHLDVWGAPVGREAFLKTLMDHSARGAKSWLNSFADDNVDDEAEELRQSMDIKNNQLLKAFNQVDLDGNGTLDKLEMMAAFKALDLIQEDTDVDQLYSMFDEDGDNEISFQEFAQTCENLGFTERLSSSINQNIPRKVEAKLIRLFVQKDEEDAGSISVDDAFEVLTNLFKLEGSQHENVLESLKTQASSVSSYENDQRLDLPLIKKVILAHQLAL